jgi:2-haloacid dehalogenase
METLNIKNIKLREDLLSLYLKLEAYPEVKSVLGNIQDMGLKTAILSNGNKKMLESAVSNAKIQNLMDEILSVDECKVYKPASIVYDLVEKKMGVNKENVLFFSSNAWDMHAASNYGFKTIWVNRFDSKLEKLPGKPNQIINSLKQIEKILKN